MKRHPLVVSGNVMGLDEQLHLEMWLLHMLLAIRTQHLIVWNKGQVTTSSPSKAWHLNVFISFQGYILFISFLLVLQHIIVGHFYGHTDSFGYFYDNDWWVPVFPPHSIYILLIQGYFFLKSSKNATEERCFQSRHPQGALKNALFFLPTKHFTAVISVLTILWNSTSAGRSQHFWTGFTQLHRMTAAGSMALYEVTKYQPV